MEDQQKVQAFLPYTPQEALADRIGSGSMIGGFENLDATCCHPSKAGPKFGIVITNQILWRLSIGRGFSQLLGHPGIRWASSHTHVDYPSGLEFDEEVGKERSKEEVGDLQEVARPDLFCMSVQKGRPLLTSWLLGANSSHVLLDSALADPQA